MPLKVPLKHSWLTFSEWSKTYGNIIFTCVPGEVTIVLNSFDVARELLEKRGSIYLGRPEWYLQNEWLGWKDNLVFSQFNDNYRRQQRLIHAYMTPHAVSTHHATLSKLSEKLLQNLKSTPERFRQHVHDFLSGAVVMITYGYDFKSDDDPRKHLIDAVGQLSAEVEVPFAMMVDSVPLLRHIPAYFPGMRFKRRALEGGKLRQEMSESFYAYSSGHAKPSLLSSILDNFYSEGGPLEIPDRNLLMNIGSTVYVAGVETTLSAISTFFLAMTMHPHVAKRAQHEIDTVTGGPGSRMPTFADRDKLPFIDAIVTETIRWHPPVPLGIPHRCERCDLYNEMTIPTNSTVIANVWHMSRDGNHYPSPHAFDPERFLRESETPLDPHSYVFGFGRRICPGLHYADAMLWIVVATVLATFDINPPIDRSTGSPLLPREDYTPALASHPEQFACVITPREGAFFNVKHPTKA